MGMMRHGSAFSGIGGFDLAAEWMGWENIFQIEIDDHCRRVLEKNFPDTKRYEDIRTFSGKGFRGTVDVVTAGFPCQPFSIAGSREGQADERYLWNETLRIIGEIKPRYFVGENVPGIIGVAFDKVCADLENAGYEVQPFIIPACAVNAWHRRDRVWFISSICGEKEKVGDCKRQGAKEDAELLFANAYGAGRKKQRFIEPDETQVSSIECTSWWETEPGVDRVVDGIPKRVDRIKGLGNAIVPQVAVEIFKIIESVEKVCGLWFVVASLALSFF